ncbi:S8 family serine peptidase [Luteimonas deserti]|uniref:S8 family serine peptidase n=1 Tax=Luteimonas deserti TaxID=2752306 RepID=A0A7Z0QR35_9GAMM|nr:autotransporter serine protease [Luteimonas deserti]NYZ63163.1 S8 family serine peptidase [Luteimonas deserti]
MKGDRTQARGRAPRRALLACALASVVAACGGGGSGGGLVQPSPPPAAPPPAPPPPTTPPPAVVQPPNPAYSRHLADTNTYAAHEAGLTGVGVRIGFLDSGINRNHPALRGRVTDNLIYVNRTTNNVDVDDVAGHGTAVAQTAAGRPFGAWPGGVAPGATVVSARIISDKPPVDDGSGNGNPVDGPLGLEPIHRDLMNRNVRIMNNSWGGLYIPNPATIAPIAAEYRPFVVQHGGLVVFASGNASRANPSDLAALPSQAAANGQRPGADLERGWLTVSALAENSTSQLASYSNACGVAMRYCLVAPGTVVVTGTNNAPDAPDYWKYNGTSLAAPLVSGAAALVWEAFPYFDNDLVRQTILGTATDIGAAGVDPVFGYGALDVGRAVRGPAKFDWGTVTANFSSGTSTWANDISGAGGLVKRGGGILRLTGVAEFGGATRAEGGTLAFVSSSIPGAATVEPGATLQLGGERIGGNLVNRGTFAVTGNTPARTISGSFQQAETGRLAWQIGAPLQVSGTASLAGDLQVTGIIGGYTHQRRENVVEAAGGITGRFATLTQGPGVFLEGNLRYDTNLAWIDVIRLNVTSAATSIAGATAQSLGSAQRVEGAFGRIDREPSALEGATSDGFVRTAGVFQSIQGEAAALTALDSLSGAQHARALGATFDTIDMGRRTVASRIGALAASDSRAGVWREAMGQGGVGGFARDGFSVDGWSIGRDHLLANGLVTGLAFGELHGDGFTTLGDRNRDRQTQAQVYLAHAFGTGYIAGQLGSGRFERDMQRQLFAGADWQGVSARYSGRYTQAAVEAGRRWHVGGAEFGPYLGAEQVRLRSDGFDELGGDGFGLRSAGWDVSRTQAIAGLRARWGAPGFALHGYGEWQHTLAASGFDLQASFTGIEAWAPIAGLSPARSGGIAGLGIESWLSPRARMAFGVDQRFGPRGTDRMASLRFAYGF